MYVLNLKYALEHDLLFVSLDHRRISLWFLGAPRGAKRKQLATGTILL